MSVIRQNYNEEAEAAINKQINMQLYASYLYQSMVRLMDKFFLLKLSFSGYQTCRVVRFQRSNEDPTFEWLSMRCYHF